MIAAPRLLIAPFIDVDAPENANAVAIAVAMLKVAALFQVFDASQVALANMLRGLHDSKWPFIIALLGYWAIGRPVGLALGFFTPLGGVGVWIGLATGPRHRRRSSALALDRQGAPGFCGLTWSSAHDQHNASHLTK